MSGRSDVYRDLWRQFHQPAALELVLEAYRHIDAFASSGDLSGDEASDLKASAFHAMRETTADDPESARRLIFAHLLPHCVKGSPDDHSEARLARRHYCEALRDWLESLEEPARSSVRDEVLDHLVRRLASARPDSACWALGVIGYRSGPIVKALWDVAERLGDESGDAALSVLSSLGLPREDRSRLVSAVCGRVPTRCNLSLVGALRRLADPECIEPVRRYYLRPEDESFWPRLSFIIVHILSGIAEECRDRPELQERLWDLILGVRHADPERIDGELYLGGDFAPRIDSSRVIPDMLRELIVAPDGTEGPEIRRIQLYQRIENCVRARQLDGWGRPMDSRTLGILRDDALRDTRVTGPFATTAGRLKVASWHLLLCQADPSMPTADSFEQAVATETSPFTRSKVSEVLACFRLDPLPETAVRWVRERKDIDRDDAANELIYRSAATRVLRSAASREAFDSLLAFGFTIGGAVLRQSADAMIDVAYSLASAGDLSVGEALANVVERGTERSHRIVAAEAFGHLAACDLLPPHLGSNLPAALHDGARDTYERSRVVEALGLLPPEFMPPDTEAQLVAWAAGRDQLAQRSLEALARQDRLFNRPELLTGRLGFRPVGERWDLDPHAAQVDGTGFVLGLLYEHHPEALVDAVSAFITSRDWVYVAELVHLLDAFHRDTGVISARIKDALVERIRLWETHSSADTELFRLLGRWDPDSLALQPWELLWDDWLPDARVALADALGEVDLRDPATHERSMRHLLALTRDGQYAVRRSSYRALARRHEATLLAFCRSSAYFDPSGGADPPGLDLRRRGAEACSWLPPADFQEAYERFATDPERPVRETAERVLSERRERLDAEHCLSHVLGVSGGSTHEMLSAWRYGRALIQTGDDACVRAIRDHTSSHPLPPNVRNWLGEIEEGIEERWRKVTQKWPEPWLSWEGSIEEGHGSVILSGEHGIPVRYSLWKQPARTSSQVHSWGGAAWPVEGSDLFLMRPGGDVTLVLADGKRGTIMIRSNSMHQVLFLGNGPYPS